MDDLILAIDLGKFNSVCRWYEPASKAATFRLPARRHGEVSQARFPTSSALPSGEEGAAGQKPDQGHSRLILRRRAPAARFVPCVSLRSIRSKSRVCGETLKRRAAGPACNLPVAARTPGSSAATSSPAQCRYPPAPLPGLPGCRGLPACVCAKLPGRNATHLVPVWPLVPVLPWIGLPPQNVTPVESKRSPFAGTTRKMACQYR